MMPASLLLKREHFKELREHLFPENVHNERAAFLFLTTRIQGKDIEFMVAEQFLVNEGDVWYSSAGYLELMDNIRGRVIKRAHDLGLSLAEAHSHRFPIPAEFSSTDIDGLREFVPHVWRRLEGRPYLALVAAPNSFDGLVWIHDAKCAELLDMLVIDQQVIEMTGRSIRAWNRDA